MDAAPKLLREDIVDCPMAINPTHAAECLRDDADAKMRLAGSIEFFFTTVVQMVVSGMQMALVQNDQALRRKVSRQLFFNCFLYRQTELLIPYVANPTLSKIPPGHAGWQIPSVELSGRRHHIRTACGKIKAGGADPVTETRCQSSTGDRPEPSSKASMMENVNSCFEASIGGILKLICWIQEGHET